MKLGLLHQVDTTKIHLKGHTSFVSFEHKTLHELAAALHICHVLEHGDDIQVSVNEYLLYLSIFDNVEIQMFKALTTPSIAVSDDASVNA